MWVSDLEIKVLGVLVRITGPEFVFVVVVDFRVLEFRV